MNPFTAGIRLGTHPSRKLLKHENSKIHKRAHTKYSNTNTDTGSYKKKSTIIDMLNDSQEKRDNIERNRNRDYVASLVKTVHFIVRKRWALDSTDEFINMLQELGTADVTEYLKFHPKLKYTSWISITELVQSISHVLEADILAAIRKADHYALLADESSDDSHREQFAILARFEFKAGRVDDYYLGLIEVRRTDAASLMQAIEGFLIAKGIDIKKQYLLVLMVVTP